MAHYLMHSTPLLTDLGILLARVFIGICFVIHGLGKLGLVGNGNMQGFAGWLKSLGLPFPELQARLAMLAEISGGLSIALGFFTRGGLLLCFFTMLMAGWLGHRRAGYLITNNPPGAEYTINLAAICVALFLLGPGGYSLDALLF